MVGQLPRPSCTDSYGTPPVTFEGPRLSRLRMDVSLGSNIAAFILERDSDVADRVVSLPAIIRTSLEELAIGC